MKIHSGRSRYRKPNTNRAKDPAMRDYCRSVWVRWSLAEAETEQRDRSHQMHEICTHEPLTAEPRTGWGCEMAYV